MKDHNPVVEEALCWLRFSEEDSSVTARLMSGGWSVRDKLAIMAKSTERADELRYPGDWPDNRDAVAVQSTSRAR